ALAAATRIVELYWAGAVRPPEIRLCRSSEAADAHRLSESRHFRASARRDAGCAPRGRGPGSAALVPAAAVDLDGPTCDVVISQRGWNHHAAWRIAPKHLSVDRAGGCHDRPGGRFVCDSGLGRSCRFPAAGSPAEWLSGGIADGGVDCGSH